MFYPIGQFYGHRSPHDQAWSENGPSLSTLIRNILIKKARLGIYEWGGFLSKTSGEGEG